MDDPKTALAWADANPKHPLAGKVRAKAEAMLASAAPAPTQPPPPTVRAPVDPGAGAAAVEGVADYGSLGFADEIRGVIGAGLEAVAPRGARAEMGASRPLVESYREERDASRQEQADAAATHPVAYHGAGIATSLAVPLGAGKAAAGLGAKVATGAALGGANALGSSQADVTRGDVEGALLDTGKGLALGGAIGAGAHAVGKGVEAVMKIGRTQRILNGVLGEGADSAGKALRGKLGARAGEGASAADEVFKRNPGLADALEKFDSPTRKLDALKAVMKKRGAEFDELYAKIEQGVGFAPAATDAALANLEKAAMAGKDARLLEQTQRVRKQFKKLFTDPKTGELEASVSAEGIRKFKGGVGEAVRDATNLTGRLEPEIYATLADAIEGAAKATKGVDVAKLRALNDDFTLFSTMKDALTKRTPAENLHRPSIIERIREAIPNAATARTVRSIGSARALPAIEAAQTRAREPNINDVLGRINVTGRNR